MLSAPHIMPAMIVVSLPAGLTAPDFTRVDRCRPPRPISPTASTPSSKPTFADLIDGPLAHIPSVICS
jgi:hypothetical protein